MENKLVEHVYENPDPEAKPLQPGDEGYVDPDEFEKKLVQEELDRMNKDPDQEEIACMMIKLYTPRFHQMVDKLSNRQLRRLLKSMVEYPIGKDYKHPSREEQEAYMLGNSIQDAKMVLAIKTYHDHADTIVAEAAKAAMENATLEFGDKAVTNEEKEVTDNG